MSQPLRFDLPAFRGGSDGLGEKGRQAGSDLSSGVSSALSPPGASSPVGNQISMFTGQLQTGLSPAGPALTSGATDISNAVQQGTSSIENQDAQNAAGFQNGGTPGDGLAGSDTPGQLDPESIDQEAKDKAQEMLGGDRMQQMMLQMLQTGLQTGSQIAQQLSQQLSQIGSQLGEVVGKAGEQVGQLASKAVESAAKSTTEAATPDFDGLGAAGGFGGGGGGGMDPGMTVPAGLETPVTPMNGSSALQASPLQAPGASPAAAASSRMPMMPMMPMHGAHGGNKGSGETTKRDPAIFPEGKLYEAPVGVEQTFGAIPEIESEEPPFGSASGTHTSGH
ncbi:hypothetical protein F0Q45_10945 [Mycobacterium simiae]|uniref:Uncharacterized protein n=1 Tax=Mycobacterium simiae TaxID=1784 RepID=A0A5B1BQ83_MYCSI|nr:hypothetical protein [Mycobacterium simiae]KAA1250192.1 hypothetical protein F0Q45_10945 [Mycobacterium simiae]